MGTTKKIKAIELVLDYNLWPRQTDRGVDSTNLGRMKASLRSGFVLPPVVINKQDNRVVDGFHRVMAHMDVFGENVEMAAEFKEYANDGDMFLDTVRLNAHQGLALSPKDRAHSILKCRKLKIPAPAIAEVLHIDVEDMQKFIEKRSARTQDGEVIPLSYGARSLAGKKLTEVQEHYARTASGSIPEVHAAILLNALKAEALVLTDKTLATLCELRALLEVICEEVA